MCGILFVWGPRAGWVVENRLASLEHRGPDASSVVTGDGWAAGFSRLAINDLSSKGMQPHRYQDWYGWFNGEIYNSEELRTTFKNLISDGSDTSVILPLLEQHNEKLLDVLDGFYSGVIFSEKRQALFVIRDPIGKKPLFLGKSGENYFICSEIKAISEPTEFKMLPTGLTKVNLVSGTTLQVASHRSWPSHPDIKLLVRQAVAKRIPSANTKAGLFFSGGLDSSIIALEALKIRPDLPVLTLGNFDSPDGNVTKNWIKHLGIENIERPPLPIPEELEQLIPQIVYATESYNPSIISNGLAGYILARHARRMGLKVVITGEGADELFCGYHKWSKKDDWPQLRATLINQLQNTELRRLDLSTMAHGIEARCPFLDLRIQTHANELEYEDFYGSAEIPVPKHYLRSAYDTELPKEIVWRRKTSFDVGSGVRQLVVQFLRQSGKSERQELKRIWQQQFPAANPEHPYFSEYPIFDPLIDRRSISHT